MSCLFKIVTALLVVLVAPAHAAEPITDSELNAIYQFLESHPDDPNVLEIIGRASGGGLKPRYLYAYLKRKPFWYKRQVCVLESLTHWGEVVDSTVEWLDEDPSMSHYVWLANSSSLCEMASAADLPKHVIVNGQLHLDDTVEILMLKDLLFAEILNSEDGRQYSDWGTYAMTMVEPARGKDEGLQFCAQFSHPDKMHGPNICFQLVNGVIGKVRVGFWIA